MATPLQTITPWGRLTRTPHQVQALHDRQQLLIDASPGEPTLAHGNSRSYGDVALNAGGRLLSTLGLDRFIGFDPGTGVIECEAGVLLDDLIKVALPQGWFLPVTPGTRFVTLGGAIANDVHGKNHHRFGSLGHHVLSLELARTDGQRITCSPEQQPEWLAASVGGLGLTGLIVSARLQLLRVAGEWMQCETLAYQSLAEFFQLSRESELGWDYVVSWVDCIHGVSGTSGNSGDVRGILFRANHAASAAAPPVDKRRKIPFTPPVSLINQATLRAFNSAYFHSQRYRQGLHTQHVLPFFYPLDSLLEWNRIYGPRGFYQYQCVLPRAAEQDACAELLRTLRAARRGSFLAVLKTFGDQAGAGLLSFPMPGTTLALDFANEGAATLQLFAQLDAIVTAAGGRLYPAKDAHMSAAMFKRGYPRWQEFLTYRDPGMASSMSRRLFGS